MFKAGYRVLNETDQIPRPPKLVHHVDVEAGLTRYKAIPTILYVVYSV